MAEPTRPADKAELLAIVQQSYDQFEHILSSVPAEQMATPGVNGTWSVKDNLAHLAAWQEYQIIRMQAALDGSTVEPPSPAPGADTEDEINDYMYEKYKDQALPEVLADFRASYQRLVAATQTMSWEMLNQPFSWSDNSAPIGAYVLGNSSGHYEEHGELIQQWQAAQK